MGHEIHSEGDYGAIMNVLHEKFIIDTAIPKGFSEQVDEANLNAVNALKWKEIFGPWQEVLGDPYDDNNEKKEGEEMVKFYPPECDQKIKETIVIE